MATVLISHKLEQQYVVVHSIMKIDSCAGSRRMGLDAYVKHCAPQTHMVVSPKRIWRGAGRQEMQIFCWIRIHNILFANRKWAVRSS